MTRKKIREKGGKKKKGMIVLRLMENKTIGEEIKK